jgi:hypothetical protein
MQTPMGGLLAHKTLNFARPSRLLISRQLRQTLAQRVNEKLLAHWEAHGQGIKKSAQKNLAAVPMPRQWRLHVNQQVADGQCVHSGFKKSWCILPVCLGACGLRWVGPCCRKSFGEPHPGMYFVGGWARLLAAPGWLFFNSVDAVMQLSYCKHWDSFPF